MAPALFKRDWLTRPEVSWLLFIGRRAPGATLEQVQAAYPTLLRRAVLASYPADDSAAERLETEEIPVTSGAHGVSSIRALYAEPLATLMIAVGMVLLVVCANVANLLLARGAARAREVGVRMALGAGRVRLVRQLLTESLMLGVLGGAAGLLLALWGSRALLTLAGSGDALPLDARLDWRVLGFTVAITGVTAGLFGLLPAIRTTRVDPGTSLRAGGRGAAGSVLGGPGRFGLGKVLVMLQVALSLTLLVGTGMLMRSTRALVNVDPGLARDRLLIVTVDAAPTGFEGERLAQLARTQLERLRALPGVAAASFSENGIFSGTESATGVRGGRVHRPHGGRLHRQLRPGGPGLCGSDRRPAGGRPRHHRAGRRARRRGSPWSTPRWPPTTSRAATRSDTGSRRTARPTRSSAWWRTPGTTSCARRRGGGCICRPSSRGRCRSSTPSSCRPRATRSGWSPRPRASWRR